jgi:transketolase N-terminal domain/subunit
MQAEPSATMTDRDTSAKLILERRRPVTPDELRRRADWIRLGAIDLIDRAGLGHYSSTFSCAEIYATLYYHTLRLRPDEPSWPDRDRFLLGKGHAATGLWPVLADLGYYPTHWLDQFGRIGSPLNDHPNMRLAPGIDFSSGSLGHNLSIATGMALGARLTNRDFRTFVVTGDGELQEGQVWEAAMAASHHKLGNLVAVVDAKRLLWLRARLGDDEYRATPQPFRVVRLACPRDRRTRCRCSGRDFRRLARPGRPAADVRDCPHSQGKGCGDDGAFASDVAHRTVVVTSKG